MRLLLDQGIPRDATSLFRAAGDESGYSGYVPELPTILVTGQSIEDLTARAKEAIRLYWESLEADRSPTSQIREAEVELPTGASAD